MNDKEMLELAAKAANYPVEVRTEWLELHKIGQVEPEKVTGESHLYLYGELWNPLIDDGDALRLAIDLGIHVKFDTWNKQALVSTIDFVCYEEAKTADRYAATRRAIVRVAAEIARAI